MRNHKRNCILLSEMIAHHFQTGMVISSNVLHFIDSTFLSPSISECEDILNDESNPESESLKELLFSPDESIQVQLESTLIEHHFEKDDEKEITDILCSKKIEAHMRFPDSRGVLHASVPDQAVMSFVSKLNIDWHPAEQILHVLDQTEDKFTVTLRMRNKKAVHSETAIEILCVFLTHADMNHPFFVNSLDYLLVIIDGHSTIDTLYEILSERKYQYNNLIQKREEFETLLTKNNLETLSLQGIHAPFVHIDDMKKRMDIIDTITLAVYGKIVYC